MATLVVRIHILNVIAKGLANNAREGRSPSTLESLAAAVRVDESNLKRTANLRSYRALRLAFALQIQPSDFYPDKETWLEKTIHKLELPWGVQ